MKPLSDLVHAHVGRTALVLGGGLSMPAQAELAPEGCVLISVNQHGCLQRRCDYIVACDDKPGKRFASPDGLVDLKSFGVPIISPRVSMASYRIFQRPGVNNSGCIAAWVAWVMGCAPILLAGMDCYAGPATYWHTPKAVSAGRGMAMERHVDKWRALQAKFPDAVIRSLGGPLDAVFPRYDAAEVIAPKLPDREELMPLICGKRVKVVRKWRTFAAGLELQVNEHEFREGNRQGSLVAL